MCNLFERGLRGEVFGGIAGKGEAAGLTVDVAQPRGGGDDSLESWRHDSIIGGGGQVVNIDCLINI